MYAGRYKCYYRQAFYSPKKVLCNETAFTSKLDNTCFKGEKNDDFANYYKAYTYIIQVSDLGISMQLHSAFTVLGEYIDHA